MNNIRSKGAKATALVFHGGTARFHGMAGSAFRMFELGIMPSPADLQIGSSAGSIVEILSNMFELEDPAILAKVESRVRSISGIVKPWSSLLRYSKSRRGMALDLKKFNDSIFADLPVRSNFLERMSENLMLITSGRLADDGYIPALTSSKQIAKIEDRNVALSRMLRAAEISCTMPPLLRPHIHPESGETYADGGLPGHPRQGHENFGEKWETDLALAIMPRGSTIFVFDPLPSGKRMRKAGVYFDKDHLDRDIITVVPTTASFLGRRNLNAALRFHPSRFDLGYKAVHEGEEKIREILQAKGIIK